MAQGAKSDADFRSHQTQEDEWPHSAQNIYVISSDGYVEDVEKIKYAGVAEW